MKFNTPEMEKSNGYKWKNILGQKEENFMI